MGQRHTGRTGAMSLSSAKTSISIRAFHSNVTGPTWWLVAGGGRWPVAGGWRLARPPTSRGPDTTNHEAEKTFRTEFSAHTPGQLTSLGPTELAFKYTWRQVDLRRAVGGGARPARWLAAGLALRPGKLAGACEQNSLHFRS